MNKVIMSIGIALAFIMLSVAVGFMFKPLSIEKKYRYKHHSHIAFFTIEIFAVTAIYVVFWICSIAFEGVKSAFNEMHLNKWIFLVIVSIYAAFKSGYKLYFNLFAKKSSEIEETNMPQQYFYFKGNDEIEEGIYVAPYCEAILATLKKLRIILTVFIAMFCGYVFYVNYQSNQSIPFAYSTLLLLPLFLTEVITYLSGNNINNKNAEEKDEQTGIPEVREKIWKSLDEEYESLWKNHLLGRYNAVNKYEYEKAKSDKNLGTDTTKEIVKQVSQNEYQNLLYTKILSPIMSGNNIIVESEWLNGFSDIIVPIVNIMYSAKKKIMFLCDNQNTVKGCEKWFEKLGLKNDLGESHIIINALNDNGTATKDTNIFIGTVDLALNEHNICFVKEVDAVFCLNADRLMAENTVQLNLLVSILCGSKKRDMQYVLFGNRVNGLAKTANQIFMTNNFSYCVVNPSFAYELSANFWATEKGKLQNRLLPASVSQYFGQLLPLLIPPLKVGLEVNHTDAVGINQPFVEYVNALQAEEQFLKTYINKHVDGVDRTIFTHENESFLDLQNNSIVSVADTYNNVALTLFNWKKYAKSNMFLNIVSAPYLLRDYIVSNIDFFIENVDLIGKMLPVPKNNNKLLLYRLINHLCYDNVSEIEILRVLQECVDEEIDISKAGQSGFITETLQKLTKKELNANINFKSYLDSNEKNIAGKIQNTYKLLDSIKDELPDRLFKTVTFIESGRINRKLKSVPVFDLYQNYLEGQCVVFD